MIDGYDELRLSLAKALRSAAAAQDAGLLRLIGVEYEGLDGAVPRDTDPRNEKLQVAITFWDFWIDSSNHDWLYYPGMQASSWPSLARSVADDLIADREISSEQVLRLVEPEPTPTSRNRAGFTEAHRVGAPSNKGMKLTKLSAAWLPGWTCRLMPAPARSDAGTASQLIPGVGRTWRRSMACWASGALALVVLAGAQDDDTRSREPVCGHHADPRGFSLDLPKGICGQRHQHGVSILLSKEGDSVARSIIVWAARNANVDAKSSDIASAEVSATASDTLVGVRVTRRANVKVAGVAAVRWRYTFHSKTDGADHEAELVAVLRPLRPHPEWQDYYEYSVVLRSTPQEYESDLKVFEEMLKSFSFGEPER